MGNSVPLCETQCKSCDNPVRRAAPSAILRRKHLVSFDVRPFGMKPANTDVGYVVTDVHIADASQPAYRLGVRPDWKFAEVNGTAVRNWTTRDIQSLLKEASLPVDIEFELPPVTVVTVTFDSQPFGLKPLTLPTQNRASLTAVATQVHKMLTRSSTSEDMTGYEVAVVEPNSPAAAEGVQAGWIISKIGDRDVRFLALNDVENSLYKASAKLPAIVQFDVRDEV